MNEGTGREEWESKHYSLLKPRTIFYVQIVRGLFTKSQIIILEITYLSGLALREIAKVKEKHLIKRALLPFLMLNYLLLNLKEISRWKKRNLVDMTSV